MTDKMKEALLTLLEIVLCLVAVLMLWIAWNAFFSLLRTEEFPPWLVSREDPYWKDALHTVEGYQWEWGIIDLLFWLCPGTLLGSAAIALFLWRQGKTVWWAGCFLTGSLTLAMIFLAFVLYEGWAFFWPLILVFIALFLYCVYHVREKRRKPYEHQTPDHP